MVALIVAGVWRLASPGRRAAATAVATQVRIKHAQAGVGLFAEHYGRAPNALEELLSNPEGMEFVSEPLVDGFGNPLVYEAPSEGVEGFIASYGRDRKPGGIGADLDFIGRLTNVAVARLHGQ